MQPIQRDPETGAFPTLTDSPLADNQDNPVRIAHEYKNETNQNRIVGGLNFELKLAKGLTFKPSLAIDIMSSENSIWYPASIGKNRTDSEASTTMTRKLMWINENILTYQKEFGDHNISAVGGMTIQKQPAQQTLHIRLSFCYRISSFHQRRCSQRRIL